MPVKSHKSGLLMLLTWTAAIYSAGMAADPAQSRTFRSTSDGAEYSYRTDARLPIISYHHRIPMLAEPQDKPLLQVFGDGRVLVHRPVYMKNAGDYRLQLSESELNAVISALGNNGLLDFDHEQVARKLDLQRQRALKQSGRFYHISDSVITEVKVRLHSFRKSANAPRRPGFIKRFRYTNLEQDAKHMSEVPEITRAARGVDSLRALMKRTVEQHNNANTD